MQHNYTDEEILHAWNHRKYLPGQRRKTLDNLKAFLEALPARPQAAEISALKAELEQTRLEYSELKRRLQVADERIEKAQAVAALRQSLLADDGRSLGQVAREAWKKALALNESQEARWMRIAQAVVAAARPAIEAECLAQAVRRMEAVPVDELLQLWWEHESISDEPAMNAVRARLIAAAKGEGQAQPVVVNEPPQDEKQPDLSGEGEKQDPYARLKDYANAGARIRCCELSWRADEIWVWDYPVDRYEVHPDDLHMCPEYAPQAEAKSEPSQPWTPAVGDTVRLKSGGPMMTVTAINTNGLCAVTEAVGQWFAGKTVMWKSFPAACLTPAQP